MQYKLLIKKFRIIRGMTQKELATKSNIRQSYISQLEENNPTKSPTLRTVFKIAKALDVCPYLLVQVKCKKKYDLTCSMICKFRIKNKPFSLFL